MLPSEHSWAAVGQWQINFWQGLHFPKRINFIAGGICWTLSLLCMCPPPFNFGWYTSHSQSLKSIWITSKLAYCSSLYMELPWKTAWKFRLAQICSTAVLKDLVAHLFPGTFSKLALNFKTLNRLGRGCLKDRLFPYCSAWKLRSSSQASALKAAAEMKGVAIRDRVFFCSNMKCPSLWTSPGTYTTVFLDTRPKCFCLPRVKRLIF